MSDLETLYKDQGYPSRSKFISLTRKLRKENKLKQTPEEVNQFLDQKIGVFDNPTRKTGHYQYPSYDYTLIADLMDLSNLSHHNQGYNWVLNILEANSRYVWSTALKNKSSNETTEAIANNFKSVLKELDPEKKFSILIVTDQGTEFKGKVSKLLAEYPWVFRRYTTATRKSTQLVERYNRTLREALKRAMATNENLNWTKVLQEVVKTYNETTHSTTDQKPIDSLIGLKHQRDSGDTATIDISNVPKPIFEVGSYVRKVLNYTNDPFAKKSFIPKLSDKVYKITKFEHGHFILDDESEVEPNQIRPTSQPKEKPKKHATRQQVKVTINQEEETKQRKSQRPLKKALKEIHTRPDYKHGVADLTLTERKSKRNINNKLKSLITEYT